MAKMRYFPIPNPYESIDTPPDEGTPLPDDSLVQCALEHGLLEIRHRGNYLEIHCVGQTRFVRMTIQPWSSYDLHVRIEPALEM